MLHPNATTYESDLRPGESAPPFLNEPTSERVGVRPERESELAVDETLAESFPASDPPSWNPGVVRPSPVSTSGRPRRRVANHTHSERLHGKSHRMTGR